MVQEVTAREFFSNDQVKRLGIPLAARVLFTQRKLGDSFWNGLEESEATTIYQVGVNHEYGVFKEKALKRLCDIADKIGEAYVEDKLATWRRILQLPNPMGEIHRRALGEIICLLRRQGKDARFADWRLVAERDLTSPLKREILQGRLATAKTFEDWWSIAIEFHRKPKSTAFQKAIGKMVSQAKNASTGNDCPMYAIEYWCKIVKLSEEGSRHSRQALAQLKRLVNGTAKRALVIGMLAPGGVAIDAEVRKFLIGFETGEAKTYFDQAMRVRLPSEVDLTQAFNRAEHLKSTDRRRLEDKAISLFRTVEEVSKFLGSLLHSTQRPEFSERVYGWLVENSETVEDFQTADQIISTKSPAKHKLIDKIISGCFFIFKN